MKIAMSAVSLKSIFSATSQADPSLTNWQKGCIISGKYSSKDNQMKIKSFAAIVDEAKATAHREVEERANAVTVRLLPWWNVVMFALSFFPGMRVHREMIRLELKRILLLRVPAIKAALIEWRIGYEDWEEENRSRGMGSEDSARREQRGKELAKKISAEMLREISDIPDYRFFFLLPKDPSAMVECPYPGFLSTKRAQKYCDELLKAI